MKLFNLMMQRATFRVVVVTVFSWILLAPPAFAGLSRTGPRNVGHGFPKWYGDAKGLLLAPCLDPAYCQLDPPDRPGNLPNPAAPISFPGNFPAEFSYWSGEARISFPSLAPSGGTGEAILNMFVKGGFTRGAVAENDQTTWSQITISITGLRPGFPVKVTHPFGVVTGGANQQGNFYYASSGNNAPDTPLSGPVTHFLVWDETQSVPDPVSGTPISSPPTGFIGDPAIPHPVTGSPFPVLANRFHVLLGSGGTSFPSEQFSTDLFRIEGREVTGSSLSDIQVRRSTYVRPLIGIPEAQIFVEGNPALASLTISSLRGGSAPLLSPMILKPALESGLFQAKLDLFEDLLGSPMMPFAVVDVQAGVVGCAGLVDEVVITEASYDRATGRLTVKAASKDEVANPQLFVLELPPPTNKLDATGTLSLLMPNPPEHVTVKTHYGGMDTALVRLSGPSSTHFAPPIPAPVANAGLPQSAIWGTEVQLSAAASTGVIEGYSWVPINPDADGRSVTLTHASTMTPSLVVPFTLNPPTPLTFEVSVSGPGGQSMSQVTITPSSPPPPPPPGFVGIDHAQAKLAKGEWKISGSMDPAPTGTTIDLWVLDPNNPGATQLIAFALPIDTAGVFQFNDKGVSLTIPQTNLHVKGISSIGIESAPFLVQAQ